MQVSSNLGHIRTLRAFAMVVVMATAVLLLFGLG